MRLGSGGEARVVESLIALFNLLKRLCLCVGVRLAVLLDRDAANLLMALNQGLQALLVAYVLTCRIELSFVQAVASIHILVTVKHAAKAAIRGLTSVGLIANATACRLNVGQIALDVLKSCLLSLNIASQRPIA